MKKKMFLALAFLCAAGISGLTAGEAAPASAGINVSNNGDFVKVIKVTGNRAKQISSAEFPKGWGASNARMEVKDGKNIVVLKNVMYSYLLLPLNQKATKVKGEIIASGTGKIKVSLSGCIRPIDDKKPFGHEIKHPITEFELTNEVKSYPVEFETEANSRYYIYVWARGKGAEAQIHKISLKR